MIEIVKRLQILLKSYILKQQVVCGLPAIPF